MKRFDKIAVVDELDNITDSAKEEIRKLSKSPVSFPSSLPGSEGDMMKSMVDADCILLSWRGEITRKVLDNCPNVRYIGLAATMTQNVPVEEIARRSIVLKNVSNYSGEATAEYIFLQLLLFARGKCDYKWRDEACELNGKTIGIIGLGDVGGHVALRARIQHEGALPSEKKKCGVRGQGHHLRAAGGAAAEERCDLGARSH